MDVLLRDWVISHLKRSLGPESSREDVALRGNIHTPQTITELLIGRDPTVDPHLQERVMLGLILTIVLIMILIGALPTWPHSRSWGYYPSGGASLILVVVVVLLLMGRI
jgi:hypothetical protein